MSPLPPLSEAEALVTAVRGQWLVVLRAMIRGSMEEGRLERFLRRLSPDAKSLIEAPSAPETWVDATVVAEVLSAHRQEMRWETGRVAGGLIFEHDVVQGVVPRAAGDRDLQRTLEELPGLWAMTHRGGCLVLDGHQGTEARISIWARHPFADFMLQHVASTWLREALARIGAREIQVDYSPPAHGGYRHQYLLRWRLT